MLGNLEKIKPRSRGIRNKPLREFKGKQKSSLLFSILTGKTGPIPNVEKMIYFAFRLIP